MKKILLSPTLMVIVLFAFCEANSQVITTVAGTDLTLPYHCGLYTGPATNADMDPIGVAVDGIGNLYIAEEGCWVVTKVDPSGTISAFAGNGIQGYNGDGGPAIAAEFNRPWGIAVDHRSGDGIGNVYITDINDYHVRKVDAFGTVSTIAGNGTASFSGNGIPATAEGIYNPTGVAVDDSGNVYIAPGYGYRVYKVNVSGTISTFAGNGMSGFSGDGGPATAATIYEAWCVAVDASGNVYISDASRVRKVATDGVISTIAGTGTGGYSGDGGPATAAAIGEPRGVAADNCGDVFISDGSNHVIRKVNTAGIISTVAGNGTAGFSGDNGPATAAELHGPEGVAVDGSGNLYIADGGNSRVRKVTFDIPCTPTKTTSIARVSVNVYPNPAHDMLNIDNVTTPTTYTIFDLPGSLIQQSRLKEGNNNISIASLPPGLYLLQLTSEEGNKTVRKIIKE